MKAGHAMNVRRTETALREDVREETRRDSSSRAAATAVGREGGAASGCPVDVDPKGSAWPGSVMTSSKNWAQWRQ